MYARKWWDFAEIRKNDHKKSVFGQLFLMGVEAINGSGEHLG